MTITLKPIGTFPPGGSPLIVGRNRRALEEMASECDWTKQFKLDIESKLMEPSQHSGGEQVQATFPALILSSNQLALSWPVLYDWAEARLVGTGQSIIYEQIKGGRSSDDEDLGQAINRVELIPGFGTDVGPYGQILVDALTTITVHPVANGSPVWITLERNDSDNIVPTFDAYNPMKTQCNPVTS